jgi:periplasmic copper chaperone A
MKMFRASVLVLFIPSVAAAHMSVASGPATANKTGQKITFGISHGCTAGNGDKLDTLSIQVDLPATEVDRTTVRPMPSDFEGKPTITKSGTSVTSVKWTRNAADLQNGDLSYYEVTLRMKVNNVPFTKVPFTITQVCRPAGGPSDGSQDVTVVWTGPDEPEPAPKLTVLPARQSGWNKFTLTTAVAAADFGAYFGDAQIVWKGTAAFSANPAIAMLIMGTMGASVLSADLAVGDEIWVKY